MFTNALAIITRIKDDLDAAVSPVVEGLTLNLDEPLDLVYTDLPMLSVFPGKEDFNFDESFQGSDKKQLSLRVELRMKGGPASTVCTPLINLIASTIRADRTLGGLADYVELGTVTWYNDKVPEGTLCAASMDVSVNYLI